MGKLSCRQKVKERYSVYSFKKCKVSDIDREWFRLAEC